MRSKSNRQLLVTVKRSPQCTHDRSRKDAQQKQSSVVGYSQAITAMYSRQKRKDAQQKQSSVVGYSQAITAMYSRQKPQGCAAKAIVSCWLQSSDHRNVLTTEAARMRSKSNRQLLVTVKRSPQCTHDRSRKDAQQKQSSVVRYSQAITAKYSRQKPQGCAQKQSSVVRYSQAITAKDSRQKPQGCAAKVIVGCSLQSGDHRKRLTTEAARICSKNRQLFDRRSLQNTHERSRNDSHTAKSFAVVV